MWAYFQLAGILQVLPIGFRELFAVHQFRDRVPKGYHVSHGETARPGDVCITQRLGYTDWSPEEINY